MLNRLRHRLHLQGWRMWALVALALIIGVRALLPFVIRKVAVAKASELLHARVDIGDVDLALLRGGIALKKVAIRPPGPEASGPDHRDSAPLIAWRRLALEIHYLPLFRHIIQLRSLKLDSPYIAVERLANGELNLLQLLRTARGDGAAQPEGAPPAKSRWRIGGDRIALEHGRIRFHDLVIPGSEPMEVALDSIEVSDIQMAPGVYGEPAHMHLALKLDNAVVYIDAGLQLREKQTDLETHLRVQRAPLQRARVYIPRVGWRDLRGELDTDLWYRLETGVRNEVRGRVSLRDVAVGVPGIETPALAWREITAELDPVDLASRHAAVRRVQVAGARVLVHLHDQKLVPAFDSAAGPPAGSQTAPAAAPASHPAQAPDGAKPWGWSIGALKVSDSVVHLMGSDADIGVKLDGERLSSEGQPPSPVQLTLALADGSVAANGQLQLRPLGFSGKVGLDKVDLPAIMRAGGFAPQDPLQSAQLTGDLTLSAGALAPTPGDVQVSGSLSLRDARAAVPAQQLEANVRQIDLTLDDMTVAGALPEANTAASSKAGDLSLRGKLLLADLQANANNPSGGTFGAQSIELNLSDLTASGVLKSQKPGATGDVNLRGKLAIAGLNTAAKDRKEFSFTARSIDVPLESISLPALLASAGAQGERRPMDIRLGDVQLTAPAAQVTRTPQGIVVPQLTAAAAPARASAKSEPASPRDGQGMAVSINSLRASAGRVVVSDHTVKPPYAGEIAPLQIDLRRIHYPELAVERVNIHGSTLPEGTISITGGFGPQGGKFEIDGKQIALTPFNPYATALSSYSINGGDLTLAAKAAFTPGRYTAKTSVTLHDLGVGGREGDALFQQQFGVPLAVALSLLRDLNGNIVLDIPVETDSQGAHVGLATVIGGALRNALINALASPLKLVGVLFQGDKPQTSAPAAITFRVGRPEPTDEGDEQLKQLATLLASRPGLGVTLQYVPGSSDERWLREQDLAADLNKPQGWLSKIRTVGQGASRDAIRAALAARAQDKPGDLSADDEKTLEQWLKERPPVPPQRLKSLGDARLACIETALGEQQVAAERVTLREAAADAPQDVPAVRIQLGSVRSASAQ